MHFHNPIAERFDPIVIDVSRSESEFREQLQNLKRESQILEFSLQIKLAEHRVKRMEQGEQLAFEEELESLKNMRERAKFRIRGDPIYRRTHQVIQLAEEFCKEMAPKFRELP